MAEKVTIMVLEVDLQCHCCYKKIKKILYKYPQIRDQVYNEKGNTVTVTVVCCSPEKIRDKLCSKGGKVIKSIEIKDPEEIRGPAEKPKGAAEDRGPAEKPQGTAGDRGPAEKPKGAAEKRGPAEKPNGPAEKSKLVVVEKPKEPKAVDPGKPKADVGKTQDKPKEAPKQKGPGPDAKAPPSEPVKLPAANPVNGIPPVAMACYGPSYDGFGGGTPWYSGYGFPPPPPQPSYDRYYGHGHGFPYGKGCHPSMCDTYFSEENPSICTIM